MGPVVAAFVLVAVGFVVAAIVSELWASRIDDEAAQIEENALPSVEHLSAARDALWHLDIAATNLVETTPDQRSSARLGVDVARRSVEHEIAAEFATDKYPEEEAADADVLAALAGLDAVLTRIRDAVDADPARARDLFRDEGRSRFEAADAAIHRLSLVNLREGHTAAVKIARVRTIAVWVTFGLTVGCVAIAIVVAALALRAVQRRRDAERAQQTLLAERSTELERFAARVAHDLLSPLSALHFTLSSLRRISETGLSPAAVIERAEPSIRRARVLVECVMDFARSGAPPDSARASLAEVLAGVLDEVRTETPAVDLVVEGDDRAFVACAPSVLTSVLWNLVRNSVKATDGPDRRLTVRVAHDEIMVHVEVEGRGAGVPESVEENVFEAYVRGSAVPSPNLALGLATVKRFVESHGGYVGVGSLAGSACTFWFDLPRAPDPRAAA